MRHKQVVFSGDWLTAGLILLLCLVGVTMVFNASHIDALIQYGDKFRFAKLQLIWLVVSLVAMLGAYLVPISWVKHISLYFMIFVIILLLLVLLPGIGSQYQGARRWLSLGNIVVQPSELAKLALVLYLPRLISKKNYLPSYLTIMLTTVLLVVVEPDFGTAFVLGAISFGLLYFAQVSFRKLAGLLLLLTICASLFIAISPYRVSRVQTFLNPSTDPHGTSYHVRQILIALGSGGFSGTGIGRSRQKFQYLPEATTDSIFAVIAEETGFLGAGTFIGLLAYLSVRMFTQANHIAESYHNLLAIGVGLWFTFQMMINLAAMVSLVPLTGIPLPFISYGGSALLSTLVAAGLYLNATRYRRL